MLIIESKKGNKVEPIANDKIIQNWRRRTDAPHKALWVFHDLVLAESFDPIDEQDAVRERVYVAGDSHVIAQAHGILKDGQIRLVPRLIRSLEAWHLSERCAETPQRICARRTLESLPRGSCVLFVAGEIDCRQGSGIDRATKHQHYQTETEAIEKTANDYVDFLAQISEKRDLTILIGIFSFFYRKLSKMYFKKARKTYLTSWTPSFSFFFFSKNNHDPPPPPPKKEPVRPIRLIQRRAGRCAQVRDRIAAFNDFVSKRAKRAMYQQEQQQQGASLQKAKLISLHPQLSDKLADSDGFMAKEVFGKVDTFHMSRQVLHALDSTIVENENT